MLAELKVPTVLISGNHDNHDDSSLYRRHGPVVDDAGVTFLDEVEGSTISLLDGEMVIWGRAMDDHHPGFRPLHGVPGRPGGRTASDPWYVVLGHGRLRWRSAPEHVDALVAHHR